MEEFNGRIKSYGTAGLPFCKCDKCGKETHCTNHKISNKYDIFRAYCSECQEQFIRGRYEVKTGIMQGTIFIGYKLNDRIINEKTVGQSYPAVNCKRLNSVIG